MSSVDPVTGLICFLVFLFSTTVHEAAHALVALRGGDPTAYLGGQVSLSPIPHIRREPIGMLVVPLLTSFTRGWAMGWASAPYHREWASLHPRRAAWMAAAGPAGNFCIALAAFLLLKIGLWTGYFIAPPSIGFNHLVAPGGTGPPTLAGFAVLVLSIFLMTNVILGTFNLLPLPPLDGAAALGLVLPGRAAEALRGLSATPGFSFVGLLLAWNVFPGLVRPLFDVVIRLLHPGAGYH